MLILICETSQIFVWRNKAFIFLQKSDINWLTDLARAMRRWTEKNKFQRQHVDISNRQVDSRSLRLDD